AFIGAITKSPDWWWARARSTVPGASPSAVSALPLPVRHPVKTPPRPPRPLRLCDVQFREPPSDDVRVGVRTGVRFGLVPRPPHRREREFLAQLHSGLVERIDAIPDAGVAGRQL